MNRMRAMVTGAVLASGVAGTAIVTTSANASTARAARSYSVELTQTGIGKILTSGYGSTLYLFTHDKGDKDSCVSIPGCTAVWPVLTTKTKPTAGPGVKASLLGTIKITKGRTQVTYAGHPLYTYEKGAGAPQTGYVGTDEFGGDWDALTASGKANKG